MGLLYGIVAFGVGAGLTAIGAYMAAERIQVWFRGRLPRSTIGHTKAGWFDQKPLFEPGVWFGEAGQDEPAELVHETVVMKPTIGARFFQVAITVFVLMSLWGPSRGAFSMGLGLDILVSTIVTYLMIFLVVYEARYNENGLTAPDPIFRRKFYPWDTLISIQQDGTWKYRVKFEGGKVSLPKYLVGMRTFLTFVAQVRELNKGR